MAAAKDHNKEQTEGKDPGTPEGEAAKAKLDEAREGGTGGGKDAPAATPAEAAARGEKFKEADAPAVNNQAGGLGEASGVDKDGNADPKAKVVNGE